MSRKPTGSQVKRRGRWVARVRWSENECEVCSHDRGIHVAKTPKTCAACTGCSGFRAIRQEWEKVADPNTKAVAGELVREKLRELAAGDAATPVAMTFEQLASRFLAAHVHDAIYENGVKISGMRDHAGFRSVIEKVFVPAIGRRRVDSLTRPEIEELRNARLAAPKLRGGRKVVETKGTRSLARVNREMAALRVVLNYALDLGVIARNPMTASRRSVSLVPTGAERPRDRVLTPAEEKRILAEYSKENRIRSRDYFVVALDSGMREAEMFGLRAQDVDLDAKLIRLPWEITKSKRGRTLPMSTRVLAIMRKRVRARDGAAHIFDDLSSTIVRKDFVAVRTAANVANFRMHDCRGTLATRLLQSGLSEAEIAMMTGHRFNQQHGQQSSAVLRKHYLRMTPKTLSRAIGALDDRVN